MTARLLDGAALGARILEEIREGVARFRASGHPPPGLGVVLVGDNPASKIYVRRKNKESLKLGMHSEVKTLPEQAPTDAVLAAVSELNTRKDIHGFLVQLPLPPQVDTERVLRSIDPAKDVDGLHPENCGLLLQGKPRFLPCTPAGILELLEREKIPIAGKRAVVVGRSDIVGKPVALLLLHRHATVTICHSKTVDLPAVCREADILVAAIGRPAMVTAEYIKEGATVIDVGISRIADRGLLVSIFGEGHPSLAKLDDPGYVLIGDVHPVQAGDRAGALTPVPGGVGPLTIAMLMRNTLRAAELQG